MPVLTFSSIYDLQEIKFGEEVKKSEPIVDRKSTEKDEAEEDEDDQEKGKKKQSTFCLQDTDTL